MAVNLFLKDFYLIKPCTHKSQGTPLFKLFCVSHSFLKVGCVPPVSLQLFAQRVAECSARELSMILLCCLERSELRHQLVGAAPR